MVISNKESFNVSIARLTGDGVPEDIYTFPAGLGAHGVAFGRKQQCDSGDSRDICYFAYVAFSFEEYLGVYDLEKIDKGQMGAPGSARETVRMEGRLADLLAGDLGLDRASLPTSALGTVLERVPITVLCPDCRAGVHVGDLPLHRTTQGNSAYIKTTLWIDDRRLGGSLNTSMEADLDVNTNIGGFGVAVRPGLLPW